MFSLLNIWKSKFSFYKYELIVSVSINETYFGDNAGDCNLVYANLGRAVSFIKLDIGTFNRVILTLWETLGEV